VPGIARFDYPGEVSLNAMLLEFSLTAIFQQISFFKSDKDLGMDQYLLIPFLGE
jgi:hypothetical protein